MRAVQCPLQCYECARTSGRGMGESARAMMQLWPGEMRSGVAHLRVVVPYARGPLRLRLELESAKTLNWKVEGERDRWLKRMKEVDTE